MHMIVEQFMTRGSLTSCCHFLSLHTEVEEVLQQVELTLRGIRLAGTVVNINLARTYHARMVHIHVVILILHHLIQVVIVGHLQRHRLRCIHLAQIVP